MKIKWRKHWKSLTINIFEFSKYRIWCYWSKFENEKASFTLILFGKFFWISTTHLGKRIYGRLYLNALFGKDFRIYSTGEFCQSEN